MMQNQLKQLVLKFLYVLMMMMNRVQRDREKHINYLEGRRKKCQSKVTFLIS
jgi:hypothetical protein